MEPATRQTARNISFFIAILATGVALGGALAHAFEFFNKMALDQERYFIVQTIYSGWNRLAYVLAFELVAILSLIVLYSRSPHVRWPVILALMFFLASQLVFWVWTFPANVATGQWTEQPENWEQLRQEWEYSHFAGAVFQLLAMASLIVAVLRR